MQTLMNSSASEIRHIVTASVAIDAYSVFNGIDFSQGHGHRRAHSTAFQHRSRGQPSAPTSPARDV